MWVEWHKYQDQRDNEALLLTQPQVWRSLPYNLPFWPLYLNLLFLLFFRTSLTMEPISYYKPLTSGSQLLGLQSTSMPSSCSSFKIHVLVFCCFRKSSATSQCTPFPGLKYSKYSRKTVPISAECPGAHAVSSSMLPIPLQSTEALNLPNKNVSLFSSWSSSCDSSSPL